RIPEIASGNGVDKAQPWNPILDKIKDALDQWNKSNPTLDAKGLIVQMTVGGMTQFLMRTPITPRGFGQRHENAPTKLTRDFIWNGKKSSPLSLQRLQQPRHKGGIDLLNIEARNFAIEITWLRSYLDTSKQLPTWSFVTDPIISCPRYGSSGFYGGQLPLVFAGNCSSSDRFD
ncbi:hypothetical protein HD554DRAFT_2016388, partial [Boletus coccyginus]